MRGNALRWIPDGILRTILAWTTELQVLVSEYPILNRRASSPQRCSSKLLALSNSYIGIFEDSFAITEWVPAEVWVRSQNKLNCRSAPPEINCLGHRYPSVKTLKSLWHSLLDNETVVDRYEYPVYRMYIRESLLILCFRMWALIYWKSKPHKLQSPARFQNLEIWVQQRFIRTRGVKSKRSQWAGRVLFENHMRSQKNQFILEDHYG